MLEKYPLAAELALRELLKYLPVELKGALIDDSLS